MKVLVCGSRTFRDRTALFAVLDDVREINGVDVIIEGCAKGPDRMAEEWAAARGIPNRHFPADWERWGKAAGHRRNAQMLRDGTPDLVVAFWDGRSSGTGGMLKSAEKAGVSTIWVRA